MPKFLICASLSLSGCDAAPNTPFDAATFNSPSFFWSGKYVERLSVVRRPRGRDEVHSGNVNPVDVGYADAEHLTR